MERPWVSWGLLLASLLALGFFAYGYRLRGRLTREVAVLRKAR